MQLITLNGIIIASHDDGQDVLKVYGEGYKSYTTNSPFEIFADISTIADAVENVNTVFSKLGIRRACRALGLEGKLNALLEASEVFRNDWTDAQDIDLSDPVLLQALQAGTFTEEEIDAIKNTLQ